jgi:hypothetical protein
MARNSRAQVPIPNTAAPIVHAIFCSKALTAVVSLPSRVSVNVLPPIARAGVGWLRFSSRASACWRRRWALDPRAGRLLSASTAS